jgi:hypothetical protein
MLRNAAENMLLGSGRLFPISALAALGKSDRFDCQHMWSQVTDIVYSSSQDGEGDSQSVCRPIHSRLYGYVSLSAARDDQIAKQTSMDKIDAFVRQVAG